MREGRPEVVVGEPVAYLYNDIRLPKLPEYDESVYPYAVIFDMTPFGYKGLYVSKSAPYINNGFAVYTVGTETAFYHVLKDSTEWEFVKYEMWSGSDGTGLDVEWTNTDILNEDGSVYLSASEPVP